MTFEEAARLDPDTEPGELDHGTWVPVARISWRHGEIAGWSIAVGNPGTELGHDPDVLRGPDVAMVRAEREPQGRGVDGWLEARRTSPWR